MNKALYYIALGGIFALPFVIFVVSGSMFFPFITGKNFLFRIITEIMFASWLLLVLHDASFRLKRSWIIWALSAFVGIMFVANVFGANFERSFWSNFERMEGFVTLLHLLAYTVVVSSVVKTEKLWMWFFRTSVSASVIMAIYGMFQLSGKLVINQGGVRVDGTFGNATYLAVYMLFHIFITLYLLVRHNGNKWWYWFYGIALALQAYILYNTATRGAILGLIGGLFLTTLLMAVFERSNQRLRKVSTGVVIGVLALVGLFLAVKDMSFVEGSPVLSRFSSISFSNRDTVARLKIWGIGWEAFKEHPILGTGQENFNLIFNVKYNPELYDQEQWFDRAHNVFIDWLTAGGVLGLLAYLSIFVVALWALWKMTTLSTTERSVITGLLAGYFFQNIFVFDNVFSYIYFATILAYIHVRWTQTEVNAEQQKRALFDSNIVQRTVPALIVVGLVGTLYFFNAPGIRSAQTLIDAIRLNEGGPTENLALFEKALALDTFGDAEIREQLVSTARLVAFDPNVPDDVKLNFVNTAREEMIRQTEETPDDARYYLFLGSMLNRLGAYDEALFNLERASELSPNKQTILFEIGQTYLAKGDAQRALEVFKNAYEIKQEYTYAQELYASAAVLAGETALADRLTEELISLSFDDDLERNYVPNDALIGAYVRTGRLDIVVTLWELRVANNLENAQFRFSLAAAYAQTGRFDEAVEQVRKGVELNPELADAGENLIREVESVQSGALQGIE